MGDVVREALERQIDWIANQFRHEMPLITRMKLDVYFKRCQAALSAYEEQQKRMAELVGVLVALLGCPALDDDFNDPEWGDGETAQAVSRARAALANTPIRESE